MGGGGVLDFIPGFLKPIFLKFCTNVCSSEELTKRNCNTVLGLVSFSVEQTLDWYKCLIHTYYIKNKSIRLQYGIDFIVQWPLRHIAVQSLLLQCCLLYRKPAAYVVKLIFHNVP